VALSFQSKYLGMSPSQCPSLFSLLSFLEYEHGVWPPTGGCGAVSATMARDLGVDIRLGEDVTRILFDGHRAVGVRTTQGEYRCDALIINADFARAMTRLVPNELQNAGVTDPTLAPPGHSTLYVLLPVSQQHPNIDWKVGIHDVERRIRWERMVTPADWDGGYQIRLGRRSTSPTTSARCCTCGRATASRSSRACT
jgi:phytoene dehydrogenase-like protein